MSDRSMLAQRKFAIRPDLDWREIRYGATRCWVARDPLSGRYFHFAEHERALLQMLDGTRTLASLCGEMSRRFAPQIFAVASVTQFLGRLADDGLLQGARAKPETSSRPKSAGLSRWLAWRLPGVDPDPLLRVISPWLGWMWTGKFAVLYVLWLLAAFIVGVTHFEEFTRTFPSLQHWLGPGVLRSTLAALLLTKLVHELGHALAAQRLGARCESMGVMLLMFVPVLYCDVSRAWMLPRRRDRILVSAAGILAELAVAAAAVFAWTMTSDPAVRLVLSSVIAVSSVNTLLVNGNPLLRYDGYYILSDLWGIPNLGDESRRQLRDSLRRWLVPGESASRPQDVHPHRAALLWYAVLAWVNRCVLVLGMAYTLFVALEALQLSALGGALGLLLLVIVLGAPLMKGVREVTRAPTVMQQTSSGGMWRGLLVLGALLLAAGAIPLPRRVDAPYQVELSAGREVRVSVAGEMRQSPGDGTTVYVGETLAVLRNPALERRLAQAENKLSMLHAQREGLLARRSLLPEADRLPALTEQILATENQIASLRRELSFLTVRSPASGVLVPPLEIPAPAESSRSPRFWTGLPTDDSNQSAWLQRGALLGEVGDPRNSVAIIYVRQQQVQSLRSGQDVRLWTAGGAQAGRVRQIGETPIEQMPRELAAKKLLPTSRSADQPLRPAEPVYRVTVELTTASPLPWRSSGWASVRVPWTTFWEQLSKDLFDKLHL